MMLLPCHLRWIVPCLAPVLVAGGCRNVAVPSTSPHVPSVANAEAVTGTDLREPILFIRPPDPGLRFVYYEADGNGWRSLADMEGAEAVRRGAARSFDLSVRGRDEGYGLRFEGYIDVPADGVYTFFVASDDGSRLLIGRTLVVDNDGLHVMREASGAIGLRAGYHPITVTCFNATGDRGLAVAVAGPGMDKQPVPAAMLYR